jgi:hypothetical protein
MTFKKSDADQLAAQIQARGEVKENLDHFSKRGASLQNIGQSPSGRNQSLLEGALKRLEPADKVIPQKPKPAKVATPTSSYGEDYPPVMIEVDEKMLRWALDHVIRKDFSSASEILRRVIKEATT